MNQIFAFIVGIEKYDQPDWDVPGPCANAIAIANWLLSIQVPPKNIFLFVEPAKDCQGSITCLKNQGVLVRSTDWPTIDKFWRDELPKNRPANSKLLFYWSGHGFAENDGTRVFICRDYTADALYNRVFNGSNFLRHLHSGKFICFAQSIFLADVCAVYSDLKFSADKTEPDSLVKDLKPIACFATPEGQYAKGGDGHGVFTGIVLRVLRQAKSWPEPGAFSRALLEECLSAGHTTFRLFYEDERQKWDRLAGTVVKDGGNALFNQVAPLLSAIPLPDSVYRPHYLRTVSDLGNPELAKAQGLLGMVRELTSLCDTYGLMQFLVRLTQEEEYKKLTAPGKERLDAWLASQAASQAHVWENVNEKIQNESKQKILIVEVMVDERGGIASFEPSLRRQDLSPVPDIRFPPQPVNSWDEFEGKLMSLIEDLRSKHSVTDFQIHFLADPPLFDRPFHRILTADGIPLGENFVVVVRYRERLRNATSVIRKLWNDYAEALRCSKPREVQLVPVWCPTGESGKPSSDQKGLCYACFAVQPASQGGSASITEEKKRLLKLLRLGVPYLYWPHQAPPSENWDQIKNRLTAWLKNLKTLDQFPDTFTAERIGGEELATQATLLWDDPQFHPFLSPRGIELR
jgi:hypothetical protein